MKMKIFCVFVCMMLVVPITVVAGDEKNPEIKDEIGDASKYVDIISAWFYEIPDDADLLFITLKVDNLRLVRFSQSFEVSFCVYNHDTNIQRDYHVSLCIGVPSLNSWVIFRLHSRRSDGIEIEGNIDIINGTITWEIPKSNIGYPAPGDRIMSTNAWSSDGQRRMIIVLPLSLFYDIIHRHPPKWLESLVGKKVDYCMDHAPDHGCGYDYRIEY